MADEYFVLQSNVSLKKDQHYYSIRGLKDSFMGDLGLTAPTAVSIENGLLEWIIPNTQYNQGWISKHYSHFKILLAGEETNQVDVKPMKGMPAPKPIGDRPVEEKKVEETKVEPVKDVVDVEFTDVKSDEPILTAPEKSENKTAFYYDTPTHPMGKKKLKTKCVEKLNELGIEPPKISSLSSLQSLLKAAGV